MRAETFFKGERFAAKRECVKAISLLILSPASREKFHALWRSVPAGLVAVTLVGVLVRLLVSCFSDGSDDIHTWERFAKELSDLGLFRTYAEDRLFNHPPLMAYYAMGVEAVSRFSGLRFACVFKFPVILAEAVSIVLVFRIWQSQKANRIALLAAAWLALNPASILVSAHHGNTDCLCAMLALLSMYYMDLQCPFSAGLSLGAAINVKLIPVILIPVLLGSATNRRTLARVVAGLAIGALPFIPVAMGAAAAFRDNAVAYNSHHNPWGIVLLIMDTWKTFPNVAETAAVYYETYGKGLVIAAAVAAGLVVLRNRTWTARRGATLVMSLFLVLAPGFGIQYIVYPMALALCCELELGALYAFLVSIFAIITYGALWTGTWPAFSLFRGYPPLAQRIGIIAWAVLIALAVRLVRTRPLPEQASRRELP